jgi:hypothetical protein
MTTFMVYFITIWYFNQGFLKLYLNIHATVNTLIDLILICPGYSLHRNFSGYWHAKAEQ